MKLKKILALALSSVLAVSMLAGCFGGGGSSDGLKKDGGMVRSSLNDSLKALDVEFEADRGFAADLATVANSATPTDIPGTLPQYITGDARSTLTYTTKATWMESAPSEKGTYVSAFWFDGNWSAYQVGNTMATYLDMAADITKSFDVTDAKMEAYKVTIGTGEQAKEVWLAGIIVTLADKAK